MTAMPAAAAANAGQPTATVWVDASAPMANSECDVVPGQGELAVAAEHVDQPGQVGQPQRLRAGRPTRLTW